MTNFILEIKHFNLFYGDFHALKDLSFPIKEHSVTALIGPSGCGKSTLLRSFNRMNDLIQGVRTEGKILFKGENIAQNGINLVSLRQKIGMVFQRPNPFPLSVRDNITFGPRVMGEKKTDILEAALEKSLERVGLWKALKDSLHKNALSLSDEQQQRLCIARLLALKPEIVLMDEPCSALDPIATLRIEELMLELKKRYTVVVVTHNMQQAARVSDETGLMYLGELIEFDNTKKIFTAPSQKITEDYVTGKFG
jgi:phosphate transport system ATP-binding protein